METTSNVCNLHFTTSLGRKRTIRIQNPHPNVAPAFVTTAANRFIAANPFDDSVGSLVDFINADRLVTTRVVLV